jgi:putative ATP-binding cassette transporter
MWKNFWALIKPYWTSEDKWNAYLLLAGIIFGTILQVRLMVILNGWRKHFYDSLQILNMHFIVLSLAEFVVIVILAIIFSTYISFFGGLLVNRWRKWMTTQYVSTWMNKHVAYAMQILNKNMDNPDQRISEDLRELPALTLSLFSGLFNAGLTFVSFSMILWGLSGSLKLGNFTIHGYMFWATLFYTTIGTFVTAWIGRNLIRLSYQQEQFNANFRFGLVRVREAAEQISLYGGQKAETQNLMTSFDAVFKNFLAIITLQKNLSFFVSGYSLMVQVVGILIALPRYLHEKLQIGSLFQVASAFEQVVDALSFIVYSFATIANWRAVIWRLSEFTALMNESAREVEGKNITSITTQENRISIKGLTLTLPSQQILVKSLDLRIQQGEHVLITGKYGSGKSTLLRALANIWPHGKGEVTLPQAKMLFLPQKPYFPLGTLKQALIYPHSEIDISDEKIIPILENCGLSYMTRYLNEVRYWPIEFSLGEQQLVAFSRIFLVEPAWVFLDEATSALDEKTEKRMYLLLQTHLPQMTIISVGHRSSLKQFHQREIYIEKEERLV